MIYLHVYNRGNEQKTIFHSDSDFKYFQSKLAFYAPKFSVLALAYCLMPNHFHLLLETEVPNNVSKLLHSLQTSYGMFYNKRHSHSGHVFESRYKMKVINTTTYLGWLVCYIHQNPVEAGISNDQEHWKFSSIRSYLDTKNPLSDRGLLSVPYAEVLGEYLERKKEREKAISEYFVD